MDLATHLTGRHLPIEILPFDFREFLRAKKFFEFDQKSELLKLLEQYLIFGGFPEVVIKNQHPRGYLDVLFDALLFKDVVKRHKVRFSEQIDQLGSYLINNISGQYSFRKLANVLKFKSDVTLERYLKYLEEAYVVFSLSGFSVKVGQRFRSPKKIYTVDNGFVASKAIRHSPDMGKLMENLVFTELVKKGAEPNRDLFYYKTRNDKEVDFVIRNGYKTSELIQVCYDLRNPDVEQREIKALFEAKDELGAEKLTVLTWDEKKQINKDGAVINFVPLWEWLIF
jgi:predicted AAA+ superfamily ATPase